MPLALPLTLPEAVLLTVTMYMKEAVALTVEVVV